MKPEASEEHVSLMLRSLPPRVPPAGLTTSLRVIASRERQRLIERRSLARVFAAWLDRTRLTLARHPASFDVARCRRPVLGGGVVQHVGGSHLSSAGQDDRPRYSHAV